MILFLLFFSSLASVVVANRDDLLRFVNEQVPGAQKVVAVIIIGGMIFGQPLAAVLGYVLNPRRLFRFRARKYTTVDEEAENKPKTVKPKPAEASEEKPS